MLQSPGEPNIHAASQENSSPFMEPEISLSCL